MAHQVRYLIALCAALLVAPWALAQRPGQIAVRFAVFAQRPVEGLTYLPGMGPAVPLKFNPATRSPRYNYLGAPIVKFTDATTGAVVAEAAIPEDMREPLLLFLDPPAPNPRNLRYQIAVLDDSTAKLGVGKLAILNLSGLKLTGTLDKTDLKVESGLNAPVPFAKAARLTFFTTARGTRVQSYSDMIRPAKTSRLLVILFPPARKGALEIQVRTLAEEPPPPPRG